MHRMINKTDFEKIRKEFTEFEESRENAITKSREAIRLSKLVIYAVQRSDLKDAEKMIVELQKTVRGLPTERFDNNMQDMAEQEFVEAACFLEFVRNEKIPTRSQLKVGTENYLLGLCDLTGELVRKAVQDVIQNNTSGAEKIHALVDEIYGEFLKFDLRNGELRKKMDSIKWNLKKLDEIMYDLKIKKSTLHE
jgi:predicted translin family RNA/ssDNA-binding protein